MPIPAEVFERVAATVAELLETPELASFALARSDRPSTAAALLGADAVIDLYRTDDPAEALALERALQTRFAAHPKARAEPLDLSSPDGTQGWVHVYVALWARAGA